MAREVDAATRKFVSDEDVARDVINLVLPVQLDPNKKLKTLHPEEVSIVTDETARTRKERHTAVSRIRDVLKEGVLLSDGEQQYLIVGMENQTNVDFAMPLRVLLMNVLNYTEQARKIAESHRKKRRESAEGGAQTSEDASMKRPVTTKEFLSGFHKSDILKPVITIVIYWSPEPWDGPRRLQDLMNIPDSLSELVDNNSLIILEPCRLTDAQLVSCTTDLRLVLKWLKDASDKQQLKKTLLADPNYRSMDAAAAEVIAAVTGVALTLPENQKKGEKVNMLPAMAEILKDERKDERDDVNAAWLKAVWQTGEMTDVAQHGDTSGEVNPSGVLAVLQEKTREKTRKKTRENTQAEMNARWARALLKRGDTVESIAEAMGETPETVQSWLAAEPATPK